MQTIGDQLVAQGKAAGRIEGRIEGRVEILLRLLHRRFGKIRADVVERVRGADIERLDAWSERILDAKTLADVFGTDRRH